LPKRAQHLLSFYHSWILHTKSSCNGHQLQLQLDGERDQIHNPVSIEPGV
jgi:hypothetical protein